MLKALGILDIFAAIVLLSAGVPGIPQGLVLVIAALICLKGFIFIFDIGSVFDIGGGILLLLSLFIALPFLLLLVFACLLGVKGILSLTA